VPAVNEARLRIGRDETLGLLGESGSDKSTLARTIVRLMVPETWAIRFRDTDQPTLSRAQRKPL
jgi:peptide/nickel transport system ATP-binding protein